MHNCSCVHRFVPFCRPSNANLIILGCPTLLILLLFFCLVTTFVCLYFYLCFVTKEREICILFSFFNASCCLVFCLCQLIVLCPTQYVSISSFQLWLLLPYQKKSPPVIYSVQKIERWIEAVRKHRKRRRICGKVGTRARTN